MWYWLVLIAKIFGALIVLAVVLAVAAGIFLLCWLAYEQANGRNPFQ